MRGSGLCAPSACAVGRSGPVPVADALRRQIGKKAKKICPTIKRRKSLATKLIPAATPALVISPYASQLWIDLDLYSGHINATSETTTAGVCT